MDRLYRLGGFSGRLAVLICAVSILAPFTSADAATYYVATNGFDGDAGTNWATAKLTISNAVEVASQGADNKVVVSNGTYNITATIEIATNLVVEGLNDPENTIVRRDAEGTAEPRICIFKLNHTGAVVSGFTVTNGYPPNQTTASGVNLLAGTVTNCIITGNWSYRGAAVHVASGGLVTHCTIENNIEVNYYFSSGGARLYGGTLANCTIRGNRNSPSEVSASAIFVSGAHDSMVRNCIISNNMPYTSGTYPDTVLTYGNYRATFENCLIVDNIGRGMKLTGSASDHSTVRNCTIARNRHNVNQGNGIYMTQGEVYNCIVYHNGNDAYAENQNNLSASAGTVSYSCMYPLISGTGNTSAAPRLVDPAAGGYSLMPGSPCIDTGTNLAAVTTDLDGNARPVDGDGDGSGDHDMGAYEVPARDSGSLRCGFTASPHVGVDLDSLNVTFTAHFAGADTNITFYRWDFGDGTITNGSDLGTMSHTYGKGFFTVSLLVSNSVNESATATVTNDIRVGPSTAYVWLSGSPEWPYDTWAKAASNIQDAVNAVVATGAQVAVVYVTNGNYGVASEIEVAKCVKVEGLNSPVVYRSGPSACRVFFVGDPSAVLSGLTITNGGGGINIYGTAVYMQQGGSVTNCRLVDNLSNRGSALYMNGGLATHCTIENNDEQGNYEGAGGVYMTGGAMVEYCTFAGNSAGNHVNGRSAVRMYGSCTVRNCVMTNNVRASSGMENHTVSMISGDVLRNCLIAGNSCRGVYMEGGGTVENCTISKNVVYGDSGNGIKMTGGLVRNTIVWDNGTNNNENVTNTVGTVEFTDVNPAIAGTGNKNEDPAFRAPGSNYRLNTASPCINIGTNQTWMTNAVDVGGNPRIQHEIVDMGAYETYIPPSGTFILFR